MVFRFKIKPAGLAFCDPFFANTRCAAGWFGKCLVLSLLPVQAGPFVVLKYIKTIVIPALFRQNPLIA
jgi:hypothetical protein